MAYKKRTLFLPIGCQRAASGFTRNTLGNRHVTGTSAGVGLTGSKGNPIMFDDSSDDCSLPPPPPPPPPPPFGALQLTNGGTKSHYVPCKKLPDPGAILSNDYFIQEGFVLFHEVFDGRDCSPTIHETIALPTVFLDSAKAMEFFQVTKIELYFGTKKMRWEKLITWHPISYRVE